MRQPRGPFGIEKGEGRGMWERHPQCAEGDWRLRGRVLQRQLGADRVSGSDRGCQRPGERGRRAGEGARLIGRGRWPVYFWQPAGTDLDQSGKVVGPYLCERAAQVEEPCPRRRAGSESERQLGWRRPPSGYRRGGPCPRAAWHLDGGWQE